MKKKKVIIIALLIILLLALIFIITLYRSEVFDRSNSEISKEDKDKMYIDALESSLEKAILDGLKELKGTSVEIDQTDQVTNVTVTLNIELETKFDEKDIDEIDSLLLGSIKDLSKENISIINQNGEKVN